MTGRARKVRLTDAGVVRLKPGKNRIHRAATTALLVLACGFVRPGIAVSCGTGP